METTTKRLRAAVEVLTGRLARLDERFAIVDDDQAYLDAMGDLESALSSMGVSLGLERRTVRLRLTTARTKEADAVFRDMKKAA